MSEHVPIKKQILDEFKEWLSSEGLTDKNYLKNLKKPLQEQLLNLTENDIFIADPVDVEAYKAIYTASVITRYKCSDGTLGDNYMEPSDEYDPDIEVYTTKYSDLNEYDKTMFIHTDGYDKLDHGIKLIEKYIKEEYKKRNARSLYNYPKEIADVSLQKMDLIYSEKREYPWRSVFATINNIKGEKVYLHITHYNFEENVCYSFGYFLYNSRWSNIDVYNKNWNKVKVSKGLFGMSF